MASPQIEDGYTRIANELLEALAKIRISEKARQILNVVFRKTYGFGKKEDSISLSQFVLLTGLNKPNVCHAINKLKLMNLIAQKDNDIANTYSINKDFQSWIPLPKKITLPKKTIIVAQKDNQPLPKKIPTINNNTQKKVTKERTPIIPLIEIPPWIPKELWNDYLEMRKKIKKPLTQKAVSLAFKKLEKLKGAGNNITEILEQSIFNSWQGLFPLIQNKFLDKNPPTKLPPPVSAKVRSPEEIEKCNQAAKEGLKQLKNILKF